MRWIKKKCLLLSTVSTTRPFPGKSICFLITTKD